MTAVNRSAIAVAGRAVTSQTWLDVVSAVDYLAAGDRHGLTVGDAIEEAIRWWTANQLDDSDPSERDRAARLPWDDPDPLRTALEHLVLHLATPEHPSTITAPDALHTALQQWVARMADAYNDGHRWTHPPDRCGYPTPTHPRSTTTMSTSHDLRGRLRPFTCISARAYMRTDIVRRWM